MKLRVQVGLGPGHIVLDGEYPGPPPQRGAAPQFSAHTCSGQMARWLKMPLGYEGKPQPKRHCIRWGPSSPPQKGDRDPNFRPVSIVPKRLDE